MGVSVRFPAYTPNSPEDGVEPCCAGTQRVQIVVGGNVGVADVVHIAGGLLGGLEHALALPSKAPSR